MLQEFQTKQDLAAYLQQLLSSSRAKEESFDDFVYMDEALALIALHADKLSLNDHFVINQLIKFCIDSTHPMAKALGLVLFSKKGVAGIRCTHHGIAQGQRQLRYYEEKKSGKKTLCFGPVQCC